MLRRVSASLFCIVLAAYASPSTAFLYARDEPPTVRVTDVFLHGTQGTTDIYLANFVGLDSAQFALNIPTNLAKVVDVVAGDIPGDFIFNSDSGQVICVWVPGGGEAPPWTGSGVWFTIVFEPIAVGSEALTHDGAFTEFNFAPPGPSVKAFEMGRLSVSPPADGGDNEQERDSSAGTDGRLESDPDACTEAETDSQTLVWQSQASHDGRPGLNSAPTLSISAGRVFPDQEVAVSATICNTGGQTASRVVSLTVDGALDQARVVSVVSGACEEVILKVTRSQPGTYQVAIDNMVGEFTVLPVVPAPPPPPGDEVVPSAGREGISTATILAIVGAMLILIATLVFFFRRN